LEKQVKILEDLLAPHLSLSEFLSLFYMKKPIAIPNNARPFCDLLSWTILKEIFEKHHDNCWPVQNGQFSPQFTNSKGQLNPFLARAAFAQGTSIVVRHSEEAHPALGEIACQFQKYFRQPIDIQLYLTPEGGEGFDWHYDIEEVFVIQTRGTKEFRLLKNTVTPLPLPLFSRGHSDFFRENRTPELRCLLHAGDWLYIPAGYWHKARAVRDSFHISVGVLSPTASIAS
jgi:50S ribosomal protein L16 3-hydroxylase